MMATLKKNLLLFFLISLVISCRKDEPVNQNLPADIPVGILNLGNTLVYNFNGRVTDESGVPVSGVLISCGNKTTYTDDNGLFALQNVTTNERLAYVKAEKPGYFRGSRSVVPSTNSSVTILIQLIPLNVAGTIPSNVPATVEVNGGVSIDFNGQFIDNNHENYSGTVTVSAFYLDPTDLNSFARMPGMLYAQNTNGEDGALMTYGMIVVELYGSSGQSLQLADGSIATLHMPVNPNQKANAPETIPLWFFDETVGYWIEDGTATLVGDEYIGNVSHFTFWNCDVFFESCLLNGLVTDGLGNPVGNATVIVESGGMISSGVSNSDGTFYTYLAAGSTATVKVSSACGGDESIYSVGPFAVDSEQSATFPISDLVSMVNIIGTIVNCDSQPVTNADVYLFDNDFCYTMHVDDGIINLNLPPCSSISSDVEMFIYDYDHPYANFSGITFSVSGTTVDLGQLEICDTISVAPPISDDEFIDLHIDGNPVMFVDSEIHFEFSDSTSFFDYVILSPSETNYIFIGTMSVPGIYPGTSYTPIIPGEMIFIDAYQMDENSVMDLSTDLVLYEGSGGHVFFTISGTFTDTSGSPHYMFANVQANIP